MTLYTIAQLVLTKYHSQCMTVGLLNYKKEHILYSPTVSMNCSVISLVTLVIP